MAQATIIRPRKYEFRGRQGDTYYWASPVPGTVFEEQVTCSVTWFWNQGR